MKSSDLTGIRQGRFAESPWIPKPLTKGFNRATDRLKLVADVLIGKAFDVDETQLVTAAMSFQRGDDGDLAAVAQAANKGRTPFHWPLEFPEVFITKGGFDACIGNPPFMGGSKITGFLGTLYREYLVRQLAKGKRGNADLCAYFFLRAAQLVRPGAGFGLIASNTIAQGDTREVAFDLLLAANFIVNRAHSSRPWPGFASLEISIVWVRKGGWNGLYVLDEKPAEGITAYLTPPSGFTGNPHRLLENESRCFMGTFLHGLGFLLDPTEAHDLLVRSDKNREVLFPYLTGEDLNTSPDQHPTRWAICFRDMPLDRMTAPAGYTGPVASDYPECLAIVRDRVKPQREDCSDSKLKTYWWKYKRQTADLYEAISGESAVLTRARIANLHSMALVPNGWIYGDKVYVFVNVPFAVMQSSLHELWARHYSSTLRTDMQYTSTDCFETFPFPVPFDGLDLIGGCYQAHRQQIMLDRKEGLTKTYNRFHETNETGADIQKLRELHVEMDRAVAAAYGWSDLNLDHDFHETKQGVRFTISEAARRHVLARLLTLNHERYAAEVRQGLHDTKSKRPAAGKPKATATKQKPAAEAPTLFNDDDATFPGTERDNYLCGLVCDLVAADPGLPVSAYVDSLVIALGHERHKRLLTGRNATKFAKLCKATPLAGWSVNDRIPWAELQNLLHQRKAIVVGGEALQAGPEWTAVRESYPTVVPELLDLLRKASAELRDLQAQVGPADTGTPDEIPAEKAEILRAFVHDRDQWYGVAA